MEVKTFTLCAVIPVSRMAGKLELFKSWVLDGQNYSIYFVIVHDWRDQETENELTSFLSTLGTENYSYISSKFGSPGMARNAGISMAVGDWLAFWDSDDLPNLNNVMAAIRASESKDEVLIGNYEQFESENGKRTEIDLRKNWLESVSMNPGLWRMVLRREAVGTTIFSDLLMGEDQLFLVEFRIFERQVKIFRDTFYSYQIMQNSQATKKKSSLKDLTRSVTLTREAIGTLEPTNLVWYQRMLVRQSLTALKRLGGIGRVKTLYQVKLFAKEYGFRNTIQLAFTIIRESRSDYSNHLSDREDIASTVKEINEK